MKISIKTLASIDKNTLINIWNWYMDTAAGDKIYPMEDLDDLYTGVKPSKLLELLADVDINDDYFYPYNDCILSGTAEEACSSVIEAPDLEALAEYIEGNMEDLLDNIECDDCANIILHADDLTMDEWETLLIVHGPITIATARHRELTLSDLAILKELKTKNTLVDDIDFNRDIDELIKMCA